MKILRILNNNVVHALDDQGKEVVFMGRGIAFQGKGGNIDASKIEKVFELNQAELNNYIRSMMEEIPAEYWDMAAQIASYVGGKLGIELKFSFIVSLVDHIYIAVNRYRNQIDIPEIFSAETKYLYPEEYKVAAQIVDMVNRRFQIALDKKEAGYIALHIIDASIDQKSGMTHSLSVLTQRILEIVDETYGDVIDKCSDNYSRFLVHLKYFAQRVYARKSGANENKYSMIFEALSRDCPGQHDCVLAIRDMLRREFQYMISKDEMGYILIYLIKVTVE